MISIDDGKRTRAKLEMAQEELIDYLFLRLKQVTCELRDLKAGLAIPRVSVDERVLEASRAVAKAKLIAPGMRPDLDIHKTGRKLVQKIKADDVEAVRDLLQHEPSLLNMRSCATGYTILHVAASAGAKNIVEYLLQNAKFDAFVTDLIGRTALHVAAENLQLPICQVFLQHYTDTVGVNAPQDIVGLTPAGCSAMKRTNREIECEKRKQCTELLHEAGDACISPMLERIERRQKPGKSSKRRSSLFKETVVNVRSPLKENSDVFNHSDTSMLYGHASMPGYRVTMEDAMCIAPDIASNGSATVSLFAVFDGHYGRGAAEFCAEHITEVFLSQDEVISGNAVIEKDALESALIKTCWDLERELASKEEFVLREVITREAMGRETRELELKATDNSGTTAIILAVCDRFYAVANIGDCRAIAIYQNSSIVLSRDHKPCISKSLADGEEMFFENEMSRIVNAGGKIDEDGYVLWNVNKPSEKLSMTRSIGDFQYKQAPDLPPEEQAIIPHPEVVFKERTNQEDLIFLACDGVWDVMGNEDVAQFLAQELGEMETVNEEVFSEACHNLLLECLKRHSEDNMTAVLILAKKRQPAEMLPEDNAVTKDLEKEENSVVDRDLTKEIQSLI